MKIKTPATSANLGVGFDCFGIALDLFNTFDVKLSDKDHLENVEEQFNNPDNLFLKAYHKGCESIGVSDSVSVIFDTQIPCSRGLGSSASLITAGLFCASALHKNALTKDEIFQLASLMEGHPDNVAPCIFGGMTISLHQDDKFITKKIEVSPEFKYTLFIPSFEVSTEEARRILPATYPRDIIARNVANSLYFIQGLEEGDNNLLQYGEKDEIHEPYRKKLIPFFDDLRKDFKEDTDGIIVISGSGSTILGISKKEISENLKQQLNYAQIVNVDLCEKGTVVIDEK